MKTLIASTLISTLLITGCGTPPRSMDNEARCKVQILSQQKPGADCGDNDWFVDLVQENPHVMENAVNDE